MQIDFRYKQASQIISSLSQMTVSFAPNLTRPPVFYDAQLQDPVRFREAICALHDVVIGDLSYQKTNKKDYRKWKALSKQYEKQFYQQIFEQSKKDALLTLGQPMPEGFESRYYSLRSLYWRKRDTFGFALYKNDPELFRRLLPCDPIITVADDIVFFEGFSKDSSSYACVSVDRNSFHHEKTSRTGTTNIDYSLSLYEHFQTLRSYRNTRFLVDPTGFEIQQETTYREEKIDLPPSWLRGFGQLQAIMSIPSEIVSLPTALVYALLSYLKRHKEKQGPRSIRFQLTPQKPPTLILEPWGILLESSGPPYTGETPREIKVWGRRRLMALSRVLPLTENFTVRLWGSGLPSIWIANMGDMKFQLALSGWVANDWTSQSQLDLFLGPYPEHVPDKPVLQYLKTQQKTDMSSLMRAFGNKFSSAQLSSALHLLAKQGQVVYDFSNNSYRFRPVMPLALSKNVFQEEHPELTQAKQLFHKVNIIKNQKLLQQCFVAAVIQKTRCEAYFNLDNVFLGATCSCDYFKRNRLKAGPCRHLLAMRHSFIQNDGEME